MANGESSETLDAPDIIVTVFLLLQKKSLQQAKVGFEHPTLGLESLND